MTKDVSQLSMGELFRIEAENQTKVLTQSLLALERDPTAVAHLTSCMRAAHSLKGAARIVDIEAGVVLANAMEDFLTAAQSGASELNQSTIDVMLSGVDLMLRIAKTPGAKDRPAGVKAEIDAFVAALGAGHLPTPVKAKRQVSAAGPPPAAPRVSPAAQPTPATPARPTLPPANSQPEQTPIAVEEAGSDRLLRVSVDNLSKLLGLAGETLIESRWLRPFGESLLRLKRMQQRSAAALDIVREALSRQSADESTEHALRDARNRLSDCEHFLADRLIELDVSDRHFTNLAHRLYDQALACRMRPLADGVVGLPRMVRDLGRSLGKQVRLQIVGGDTQVDRDILEKLDAPLTHLLRNAIDHGIETPELRLAAGKAAEGVILLEAYHNAGALQIIVSDDGRGINLPGLRTAIVERGLATDEVAARLDERELLEFLFLPGFSMKGEVTEISGRGVGLNVVQDMIREVRGKVRVSSELGKSTRFQMQLPLTLSVVRALLVQIAGEAYGMPFAHVVHAVSLQREQIEFLQGRQYFHFNGEQIGLVDASQVLGRSEPRPETATLSVAVIGPRDSRYGLVVDRFMGGRELVIQKLDPALGKIEDVSAAALLEDGSPVLILDIEDMIRSTEKLVQTERLKQIERGAAASPSRRRKRVLVVDDLLTVRELERKMLDRSGYEVEIAVDGVDGWNTLRGGRFDLVIADVDMPRMDGIELVTLIKRDAKFKTLPVMILSYKDREEDRRRGLAAGADYYMTKGSFRDDGLLRAVIDLIGEAAE